MNNAGVMFQSFLFWKYVLNAPPNRMVVALKQVSILLILEVCLKLFLSVAHFAKDAGFNPSYFGSMS